jgi:hypothetical protein
MPKVSKATASSHVQIPGAMESFSHETEGWTVSFDTYSIDVEGAFLFKGAPNDQCQATHMGYILKGKMAIRTAGGAEEVFEAGDAYFTAPGHTPVYFAGLEIVDFTRTEDMNRQLAFMAPNLKKYLEEHGMEVPPEFQAQP